MDITETLKAKLREYDANIVGLSISPSSIIFEDKINLLCFHCSHYNYKFTCPPKIPKLDYKYILTSEYENAMLVYTRMSVNETTFTEIRTTSTNVLHKALLYLESVLYANNIPTSISLIGGSCKLCKSGCPSDRCNNPYQSRMPMEAVGINVIKTAKQYGIDITFPVSDSLLRCGLLLW